MPNKQNLNLDDDAVYYGKEANQAYMGVSQFKRFMDCEARAAAELNGSWERGTDSQPLIIGNYVHSFFESAESHETFKEEHKDKLFSKRKPYGLLKAYEQADVMIQRISEEPLFKYLWQGTKETVVTGSLHGIEWKGKIDLLNVEKGYFVDLKTTADMRKRFYNERYGTYVSFVEHYGYVLQMAVYEQLLELQYGKPFVGYIYAVSKQDTPEVCAIEVEQYKKDFELDYLADNIGRIIDVKKEEEEPIGCGKCDYCKTFKKLDGFVTTEQLIG